MYCEVNVREYLLNKFILSLTLQHLQTLISSIFISLVVNKTKQKYVSHVTDDPESPDSLHHIICFFRLGYL